MTRMLSRALVAGLAAAAAACSIDVRGDEIVVREERRFTVVDDLELALSTFDGAIEVKSWDRPEVLIEIERRAASGAEAQALEVKTSQEGNRLTVDAPSGRRTDNDGVIQIGGWQSPSVSLRVTVPARLTLEARTGDGPVAARDLVGRVTLRTADGPVNTDRLVGDVTINTGDGPVVARDTRGTLDLQTGDGAVDVSGRLETLRVRTGDGPVRVDAHDGSVSKGEWTVETGDGAITVRLPAGFSAEVDAFSGDGRIAIAGVGNATSSDDDDRPAQLRTRLGNGGPTLRLRTGDGPIRVDR